AARSGVSAGLISQIERGLGNPSFLTLGRLAVALDTPMSSFYQGPAREGEFVVRKNERKTLAFPHEGVTYELLMPDFNSLNSPVHLLKCRFPPGFDNSGSATSRHPGRKVTFLLSGQIAYTLDGREYLLEPGDSVTHDTMLTSVMRNRTKAAAEAIILID